MTRRTRVMRENQGRNRLTHEEEAARRRREIDETAQTLIEERGYKNALAWANHCAMRSTDGFWRNIAFAIQTAGQAENE